VGQNFVWVGEARAWVGHGLPSLIAIEPTLAFLSLPYISTLAIYYYYSARNLIFFFRDVNAGQVWAETSTCEAKKTCEAKATMSEAVGEANDNYHTISNAGYANSRVFNPKMYISYSLSNITVIVVATP